MAKLAIRGHLTRGKEVIETLMMLGGINLKRLMGTDSDAYYTIANDGTISGIIDAYLSKCSHYARYTIEDFLEKYPYKFGDKVYYDNKICDVIEMLWNSNLNTISYGICDGKSKNLAIVEELKPYKEETMETITIDDFKANTKEWLIDKLESMSKDNALQAICDIHDELHKPKYPKTYKECCDILGISTMDNDAQGYKGDLIIRFQELLIARDAYWKIAGEQMGLGKPNFTDTSQRKYCIYNNRGNIQRDVLYFANITLAFPTKEMRDAFHENFKELIERCKELL